MSITTTEEYRELIDAPKFFPCISVIMPFEPKMSLKNEIQYKLKVAKEKIEKEVLASYPEDKVQPVLLKLDRLLKELNYNTHKKSVAIFVSPLIDKVYYLDIPVKERIIINESFEIRNLVEEKKEIKKYLLAVLSGKSIKVYLSDHQKLIPVMLDVPEHIAAYKNIIPEKVGNFTDATKRKETMLDKFLHHIDKGLTLLIQAYHLPLFIMANDRTLGHFKKISHNQQSVVEFIHGDYEDKGPDELLLLMKPYVEDWKKIIQSKLKEQIDDALGHQKLAFGIKEVWKAATQKKGKLLIVEKNFIYPAQHGANKEDISDYEPVGSNSFYIKDAVDDIIEKVLVYGGDVEFVEEGFLDQYLKIALIEYY
ncbi:MAG: hypothetical protein JST96_08645 [Bacteroidetes bacterium]|nr:hypothetical protein [Bacteroidota bacterium]